MQAMELYQLLVRQRRDVLRIAATHMRVRAARVQLLLHAPASAVVLDR